MARFFIRDGAVPGWRVSLGSSGQRAAGSATAQSGILNEAQAIARGLKDVATQAPESLPTGPLINLVAGKLHPDVLCCNSYGRPYDVVNGDDGGSAYPGSNSFNGIWNNEATSWITGSAGAGVPYWVSVSPRAGVKTPITRYKLRRCTASGYDVYMPNLWLLQGSDDALTNTGTWTTIDDRSGTRFNFGAQDTFEGAVSASYKHYRIWFPPHASPIDHVGLVVGEIELWGPSATGVPVQFALTGGVLDSTLQYTAPDGTVVNANSSYPFGALSKCFDGVINPGGLANEFISGAGSDLYLTFTFPASRTITEVKTSGYHPNPAEGNTVDVQWWTGSAWQSAGTYQQGVDGVLRGVSALALTTPKLRLRFSDPLVGTGGAGHCAEVQITGY